MLDDREVVEKRIQEIMKYGENFFASDLPGKWQVNRAEYLALAQKAVAEMTKGVTRGKRLVRLVGCSGSGKTTQLLPAAQAWFSDAKPVVVAAREFVRYHPYLAEIVQAYGESEVRKKTDGFVCVMMFLVLQALMSGGYDIIVDLAFVTAKIEEILVGMVGMAKYEMWIMMIVAPVEVLRRRLNERGWRHDAKSEAEFLRATGEALEFYAKKLPEMRIVLWGGADLKPAYDGVMRGVLETWQEKEREDVAERDLDELIAAKINYFKNN